MDYGIYALSPGDDGTHQTLARMRQLAVDGAVTPTIRRVAARLVLGVEADPAWHARMIRDFIESHTQFLADPSVAEALTPPADLVMDCLRNGIAQVDCDDVAMLTAALGMSIGLRARFVVVAFHSPNAPFAHVWTDLGDAAGQQWWSVDPNRHEQAFHAISRMHTLEL